MFTLKSSDKKFACFTFIYVMKKKSKFTKRKHIKQLTCFTFIFILHKKDEFICTIYLVYHKIIEFSYLSNVKQSTYILRSFISLKNFVVFTTISASEKTQLSKSGIFYEKSNNVPIQLNYPLNRRRRRNLVTKKLAVKQFRRIF